MPSKLPNNPDAWFLDFDGVVIESTDIKTEAFYELYLPYGEEVAASARAYHLAHQGTSRFDKFEAIARIYLQHSCDKIEQDRLSAQFSAIVMRRILNCPFVDGAVEFLERQRRQDIPVFLFSATPHEELNDIVEKRGIASLFTAIYGTPKTKVEAGGEMIRLYELNPANVVFVGDSPSDEKAARALGTPFMGRLSSPDNSAFTAPVRVIASFRELL